LPVIYFSIANPSDNAKWLDNLGNAKIWQEKVLAVDPKDPEAAYTVGVIDWMEAMQIFFRLCRRGDQRRRQW